MKESDDSGRADEGKQIVTQERGVSTSEGGGEGRAVTKMMSVVTCSL